MSTPRWGCSSDDRQSGARELESFTMVRSISIDTFLSAERIYPDVPGARRTSPNSSWPFLPILHRSSASRSRLGPSNYSLTGTSTNANCDLIDTRAADYVRVEDPSVGVNVTECDVIAKTVEGGVEKGYLRQSKVEARIYPMTTVSPSAKPPCARRRILRALLRPLPIPRCRRGPERAWASIATRIRAVERCRDQQWDVRGRR